MWVRISLLALKLQLWRLLRGRSSLTFMQTIECGFSLILVCDTIMPYSPMNRTDKYLQHSSIIWPVWLYGWVFVYELSDYWFESRCCHLNSSASHNNFSLNSAASWSQKYILTIWIVPKKYFCTTSVVI